MAEITNSSIRIARESQKMPRWKLSQLLEYVSEDKLERWEKDEQQPHPDDVDKIGRILGDPTLWDRWMKDNFESYRARYPEIENYALPISIIRAKHEMQDVLNMQDEVERDAMSGRIDCPVRKEQYRKELQELVAAVNDVLNQL